MSGGHDQELADLDGLYDEDYDFPRQSQPRLRYLIATTQRTGSNFLALELWRTGAFGAPLEYLRAATIARLGQRLGAKGPAYWRALQLRRTSPNGVFGFKAFGSHIKECSRDMPALFAACLPADHVIYLTRENKDCQAISLARATQTHAWTSGAQPAAPHYYDAQLIAGCRDFIERQESAWLRHFDLTRSTPVFVTYEALVDAPEQVVRRIAQSLRIDVRACRRVCAPTLRRQADDHSLEWLQRLNATQRQPGNLPQA